MTHLTETCWADLKNALGARVSKFSSDQAYSAVKSHSLISYNALDLPFFLTTYAHHNNKIHTKYCALYVWMQLNLWFAAYLATKIYEHLSEAVNSQCYIISDSETRKIISDSETNIYSTEYSHTFFYKRRLISFF